jgi:lipoate-protein ligase A
MVRRPSGGRAVWHAGDLTYALVIPRPPGSVAQVYAQVSQFLVRAFAHLGLPLQFGTAGRGYIHNPSCFGTATGADLLFGGRKLVGSAQLHRGGGLLQHGSILLAPDRPALGALFGPETAQAVVGLDEILPDLAIHTLQAALEAALGEVFACQIVDGALDGDERGRVEALRPRMRVEPFPGATRPQGNS